MGKTFFDLERKFLALKNQKILSPVAQAPKIKKFFFCQFKVNSKIFLRPAEALR